MKKIKKVLFPLLLVLLVSSCFGTVSMAASSNVVAKIGSKSYTSLQAAFNSVKKGQTIKLQKNISLKSDVTMKSNVSCTLNLNGYKITFKENTALYLKKGTLTIKNGTLKGKGDDGGYIKTTSKSKIIIASGTYSNIHIINSGKLTIKDGTFKDAKTASLPIIQNNGTLVIKDGTFTCKNTAVLFQNAKSAKTTISGGTFKVSKEWCWIINNVKGSVTVNGGTFTHTSTGLFYNSSQMTINDGKFSCKSSNGKISSETGNYIFSNYGTLTITGGEFNSKYGVVFCYGDSNQVSIKGGTFVMTDTGSILYANNKSSIIVSDGVFTGKNGYCYETKNNGVVTLNGGSIQTLYISPES